ncbi:pertactin family virulence factor/autotransporter [Bartonella australis AUST/NH1]|uniref:Pertactin family virulence factor/autotransporter n=1 Tax=Bartonella australis (strain Aust/NH1) TaxID=1094489 RepID=M1NY05_BARAA|nr:pertactin-like passenger domain-containing protein [Bartonella australis]AGF74357.1 pertactin family virulence factor/autotransporter [Bartonella australis AUST/NH1]
MRYKSSFSLLMMSGLWVQAASAGGDISEFIKELQANGPKTSKGFVASGPVVRNTAVGNGDVEVVEKEKISAGAKVGVGGSQAVMCGGKSLWPVIMGGEQFVFEGNGLTDRSGECSNYGDSVTSDTIIYGDDEALGVQNIYNNGFAWGTHIGPQGVQNIFGASMYYNGGVASKTAVYNEGRQNIWGKGQADDVTLKKGAMQVIYLGGSAKNLTIEDGGHSWIYDGVKLERSTKVDNNGHLHLYSGITGGRFRKEKISLRGGASEEVFFVDSGSSRFDIENLNGQGGIISFGSFGPDKRFSKLHVIQLSGGLHFNFRINIGAGGGDYLFIKEGAGDHTVSVVDTGIEVANHFSQISTGVSALDLITDESGGAKFSLKSFFVANAPAIDLGAYMYELKQRINGPGKEKIWYLSASVSEAGRMTHPSRSTVPQSPVLDDSIFLSVQPGGEADSRKRTPRHLASNSGNPSFSSPVFTVVNKNIEEKLKSTIYDQVIGGGDLLIVNSLSNGTKINDSGIEFVESGGYSMGAVVNVGGKQVVKGGGFTWYTNINGGAQFIFSEEDSFGDVRGGGSSGKRSGAYNTSVNGNNRTHGQQNIYDGGVVWGTKIGEGGVQNLYQVSIKNPSIAWKTVIDNGGRQNVFEGGQARGVIVEKGGMQVVYFGGFTEDVTVKKAGHSWVFSGAKLGGSMEVQDGGYLHLFAGDNTPHVASKTIIVKEQPPETVFSDGGGKNSSRFDVKKLSGEGGRIIFDSVDYNKGFSQLKVDDLSGRLSFNFRVDFAGHHSDYLVIKRGSGNHAIKIIDSGDEIKNPVPRKNSLAAGINLIMDKSGGANFFLEGSFGDEIYSVDAGAYTYILQYQDMSHKPNKKGRESRGKIWYLAVASSRESQYSSFTSRKIVKRPQGSSLTVSSLDNSGSSAKSQKRPPQRVSRKLESANPSSSKDSGKKQSRRRPPRHVVDEAQISSLLVASVDDADVGTSVRQGQRRSRRHVVEDTQIADLSAVAVEAEIIDVSENQGRSRRRVIREEEVTDLSAVSPSILERRANGADVFESGLKRPEVSASSALMSDDKDDAVMVAFDSKLMSDDATVVFGDETLDLSDDKNDAAMVASDPELMSDDATVASVR